MLSMVAIILEALLKNVREVSHELMEGKLTFSVYPEKSPSKVSFIHPPTGFIRIGPQIF